MLLYESRTCTSYIPIRKTPLLPRSWLSPLGGVGARHSMCSWQSPNPSRVSIMPAPGTTSIAPSTILHFAGPCVLSDDRHLASDFPSNSTIASDGGGAGTKAPGLTI